MQFISLPQPLTTPTVPEKLLRKLLHKATTEVEFSCNGELYRQVDGVAMGSPLGPVLANIFVGFCENQLDRDEFPLLYCRFVDDTFSIFSSRKKSEEFFLKLNRLNPALRFTVECEEDGRLPFMDVQIRRTDGIFERSIYRKPTFTCIYTRWDSFSPTSQKIGLMRSLTSRAHRLCSPSTLGEEIKTLQGIFLDNGCPGHLVQRIVQAALTTGSTKNQSENSTGAAHFIIMRLPWIGHTSTEFAREIKNEIKTSLAGVESRLVFTTTKAFSGRHKDVLPTTAQSFVIYEFTCRCGRAYVGKTTQCLAERIKQHIPDKLLNITAQAATKRTDSAIMRHLKDSPECQSPGIRSHFKVLKKARLQQQLDILEAIFICAKSPALFQQKEHVRNLSLV